MAGERYRNLDLDAMAPEDIYQLAYNDDEWGKKPCSFLRFVAIDAAMLQAFINDLTDDEVVQVMRMFASYCIAGELIDYDACISSAVKITLRSICEAHDARMRGEYVRNYKRHVSFQKKQLENS